MTITHFVTMLLDLLYSLFSFRPIISALILKLNLNPLFSSVPFSPPCLLLFHCYLILFPPRLHYVPSITLRVVHSKTFSFSFFLYISIQFLCVFHFMLSICCCPALYVELGLCLARMQVFSSTF